MHIQAKAQTTASPADLAKFLTVLVGPPEDEINIEGVTGARIEADPAGEFVFAVEHGRAGDAHDRLVGAHYNVLWTTDLYTERIPGPLAQDPPPLGALPPVEHPPQRLPGGGQAALVEEAQSPEVEHDLRHPAGEEHADGGMADRAVGQNVHQPRHAPVDLRPVRHRGPAGGTTALTPPAPTTRSRPGPSRSPRCRTRTHTRAGNR